MPRKVATVEQERNEIKRKYKLGAKKPTLVSDESLTDFERELKQEMACFLKAQDYSYTFMGNQIGIAPNTIKKWFAENDDMRKRTAEIKRDFVDGAIKLMKTYAIELVEIVMGIARTSDDKTALAAAESLWDRMGLAKVNKSESATVHTRKTELDLTDKTGLLERARNAPPEVQAAMAQAADTLLMLGSEHAEPIEEHEESIHA